MFTRQELSYDFLDKVRAFGAGGLGLIHTLVQRVGLPAAIDRELKVFKVHLPYFESDHVLNIAYNILAGGTCLEDLERLRTNETYLAALGAKRTPDPTTAGDFLRRLGESEIARLMEVVNQVRVRIWRMQPPSFRNEARIYVDGSIVSTYGECKQGMDITYKGEWGYHPLIVSLDNTQEPLFLVNRPGSRPSHDDAARWIDKAIDLCAPVFRNVVVAGDTDFALTEHLDGWNDRGVTFVLGFDAARPLTARAIELPETEWKRLCRPAKHDLKTQPRAKPARVKQQIVEERGYEDIQLESEDVAEFSYQPRKCRHAYRVVVLRKNLNIIDGQRTLFPDVRFHFYITNDWTTPTEEVVFSANARCRQENVIEQLKNGVHAMEMPVHDLNSNWAYMVIASLAWTLKTWCALLHPDHATGLSLLRMEFKAFLHNLMLIPCQIVRTGRRIVHRLLCYSEWVPRLLKGVDAIRRFRFT
jgi:DDE family transposase